MGRGSLCRWDPGEEHGQHTILQSDPDTLDLESSKNEPQCSAIDDAAQALKVTHRNVRWEFESPKERSSSPFA